MYHAGLLFNQACNMRKSPVLIYDHLPKGSKASAMTIMEPRSTLFPMVARGRRTMPNGYFALMPNAQVMNTAHCLRCSIKRSARTDRVSRSIFMVITSPRMTIDGTKAKSVAERNPPRPKWASVSKETKIRLR